MVYIVKEKLAHLQYWCFLYVKNLIRKTTQALYVVWKKTMFKSFKRYQTNLVLVPLKSCKIFTRKWSSENKKAHMLPSS